MKKLILALLTTLVPGIGLSDPSLWIYDQNLGLVHETIPLKLKKGVNEVRYPDATGHVETESIILRDPSATVKLRLMEQTYRTKPLSPSEMLHLYEGKQLEFVVRESQKPDRIVTGKVISSGYTPARNLTATRLFRNEQNNYSQARDQLIIEIDGKLSMTMPGDPVFPAPVDTTIFRPSLNWKIHSNKAAKIAAELSYLTTGLAWQANYNLIFAEDSSTLDLSGWVTIENNSGKTFARCKVQLVAGSLITQSEQQNQYRQSQIPALLSAVRTNTAQPEDKVTAAAFTYPLPRAFTLPDQATKQVELVRAENVLSHCLFVYDGAFVDRSRNNRHSLEDIRKDEKYGTQDNPNVWRIHEIEKMPKGAQSLPLPTGKMRIYQRTTEGQLQFLGEDVLEHTLRGQPLRLYTGDVPDLTGERKRTSIKTERSRNGMEETFEITVRNRKEDEAVEIKIIEHLYRGKNWEIRDNSNTFLKTDDQTVEFLIPLAAGQAHTLSYTVDYSW